MLYPFWQKTMLASLQCVSFILAPHCLQAMSRPQRCLESSLNCFLRECCRFSTGAVLVHAGYSENHGARGWKLCRGVHDVSDLLQNGIEEIVVIDSMWLSDKHRLYFPTNTSRLTMEVSCVTELHRWRIARQCQSIKSKN